MDTRKLISSRWMVAALLGALLASIPAHGQSEAEKALIEKARSLDARGRTDLALQNWQQVLLSDPKNAEALAGVAKGDMLEGKTQEAQIYLDRLRGVNPADPRIAEIENVQKQRAAAPQLGRAGKLAESGQYAQAMQVYRQAYGNNPPAGDIAVAYYETEASTDDNGRVQAIAGLRNMAALYPGDSRYSITLGRLLTYQPKTRAEGIAMLQRYPQDLGASQALRQALTWDSANPASGGSIRAYLKNHPDKDLQLRLEETQAKQAHISGDFAKTAPERAAYAALAANNLPVAEDRFNAIKEKEPNNPRALTGLGFVQMKKNNFGGAISYLDAAKANGAKGRAIDDALATSHFWFVMSEGTAALNQNQVNEALGEFRKALEMRPSSPDALRGLAGTLLRAQQPADAAQVYAHLAKVQPGSPDGWRGLFTAQYTMGDAHAALATVAHFPPPVRKQLAGDPEYLTNLAAAYSAVGDQADSQRVLAQAMEIPFPDNGAKMKPETQLQFAALLMQAHQYEKAAGIYHQVIAADPNQLAAYEGLIRGQHAMGNDAMALSTVEQMPSPVLTVAERDPGFLATIAAVYQSQGKLDIAQKFMEQAMTESTAGGQAPTVNVQLELAGIYSQQGNSQAAYAIYQQLLTADPQRLDAWKGVISTLHQNDRDSEAVTELRQIPQVAMIKLNTDPQFLQVMASVYNGTGNMSAALATIHQAAIRYQQANMQPPIGFAVQYCYLLLNAGDDQGLYLQLMQLGSRNDLTDDQRAQVQTVWAVWSVRRAAAASKHGNYSRAVQILDAANRAFPNNLDVQKALAGGYQQAGQSKRGEAIYLQMSWDNATAADYRAAIGAALSAHDTKQAHLWLESALKQYPNDPQVLQEAAQYEQAKGDNPRAAEYYKAALDAMGPADPAQSLISDMKQNPDGASGMMAQTNPSQELINELAPGNDALSTQPMPLYQMMAPTVPAGDYLPGQAAVPVQISPGGMAVGPMPGSQPGYSQDGYAKHGYSQHGYSPATSAQRRERAVQQLATPQPTGERLGDYNPPQSSLSPADVCALTRMAGSVCEQGTQDNSGWTVRAAVFQVASGQVAEPAIAPAQIAPNAAPAARLHLRMPVQSTPEVAPQQAAESAPRPVEEVPGIRYAPMAGSEIFREVRYQAAGGTNAATSLQAAVRLIGKPTAPAETAVAEIAYLVIPAQDQATPAAAAPPVPAVTTPAVTTPAVTTPAVTTPGTTTQAVPTAATAQPTPASDTTPTPATAAAPTPQSVPAGSTTQPLPAASQPAAATVPSAPSQPYSAGPTPASGPGQPGQVGYGTYSQGAGSPYNPAYGPGYSGYNDSKVPVQQQPYYSRVLPPLSGSYQQATHMGTQTQRDQISEQLAALQGGYSPWIGGTALLSYRSGQPGFDRFIVFQTPIEASAVFNDSVRATIVLRPVLIDSGTPAASSIYRLGSLPLGATPPTQTASGIGGEVQLRSVNYGVSAGYTPYGFVVGNFIGSVYAKPEGGPFTLSFTRDSITDTQLSYSGLHDTGQAGGPIWGGVVANSGQVQYATTTDHSGYYIQGGMQYITGKNVEDNYQANGDVGAYWRVKEIAEYGTFTLGMNFFAMHYEHNLRYFTFGQGGYFSPDAYVLANIPVRFNGHYGRNFHYVINGSLGVQGFQEDASPFFPLTQKGSCTAASTSCYGTRDSISGNYLIDAEAAYRVAEHWYVGGLVTANNSRDYNSATVGFYVRYMFRPQFPTEEGPPTGIFPVNGLRPVQVP